MESIDQVLQVDLEKVDDDTERIFVWRRIKIERSSQEVTRTICQEKLLCRRCVPPHVKKDATYPMRSMDERLIDRTCPDRVPHCHVEGVINKLVEIIGSDPLVTDVDPGGKTGKVDIYPIGILRYGIKEAAVFQNFRVDRKIKAIGIAGLVERLVLMRGKVDPVIALSFWRVRAIT